MRIRTVGRWMGLAAGVLGLGGWGLALGVASAMSGLSPGTVVFFVVMLLAVGGVAVGTHGFHLLGKQTALRGHVQP